MRININKLRTGTIVLLTALIVASCNSKHKEDDGHNHGTTKEAGTDTHGHEEGEAETTASLSSDQIEAVGIQFGLIEKKNLTASIKANGILRVPNNNRANVTPLYGGVVKTLKVELGDQVKKGQVIATIVNPQFVQLQEEYLTIRSEIVLAEQELQRQQELNEGNAGAKRNLQNATSQLNTLRARRASLQQQIQLMEIDPATVSASSLKSAVTVTSPIDGVISNVYARLGSYVDVSSPLVEVVDNNMLHVDMQIFERDLPKMKTGQVINFVITNNPTTTYSAKVFRIGASFENESKTIAVHCHVTGNKKGLIDGMSITGTISLSDVFNTAVPDEAIVEADGKFYVFVITDKKEEDGHTHEDHDHDHDHKSQSEEGQINFQKIEVVKGVSDMGYTAVAPVTDIAADTKIVIKGAFFINAKMSGSVGHQH